LIGSSELDVTDVLDQGPCVLKAVNTRQAVCEGSFWVFLVSLVFFRCTLILDVREMTPAKIAVVAALAYRTEKHQFPPPNTFDEKDGRSGRQEVFCSVQGGEQTCEEIVHSKS